MRRTRRSLWALSLAMLVTSCGADAARPSWPARPQTTASHAFWAGWGDGLAEVSSYRGTVMRYGAARPAEWVLIYVTEPLDRRTWIKDDDVPAAHRVQTLKLNSVLRFQTGIYPYTVMTSVFSPVDGYFGDRFAPAKITLGAQEWCGHVWAGVWPSSGQFTSRVMSYFAGEGDREARVAVPEGALYEDALPIQLRELDGPFASGGDWRGQLVPGLWRTRRDHTELQPVEATITRRTEGDRVLFTLRAGDHERVYEVEASAAHRLLGWHSSDGDALTLVETARLPYWDLHDPGEERARSSVGLPIEVGPGLAGTAPPE